MALVTINDYVAKLRASNSPDLQTNCESLKKIIAGAKPDLKAAVNTSELIPVLLALLSAKSSQVEIATPIIAILFVISGWEENRAINEATQLYVQCFRQHIESEQFCRTILGLLYQICTNPGIKTELIHYGITDLLNRSVELHSGSERVFFGLKRLVSKLATTSELKPALVDFSAIIIGVTSTLSSEASPSDDHVKILQLCIDMLILIFMDNPAAHDLIERTYEILVSVSRHADEITYMNIDKILVQNGRTIVGAPIDTPYSVHTPKGFRDVRPLGAGEIPNVYTTMGHGSEIISETPIPVPKGCVYVTFAICGETTTGAYRILDAFVRSDIRELLRDPVKNIRALTEHFGESLHVHYPEAEAETSRTYYDVRYSPFAHFNKPDHGCFAYKSGIYSMDSEVEFMPSDNLMVKLTPILKYGLKFACDGIERKTLRLIYDGSLYPTLDTIIGDIDPTRTISYKLMKHETAKFKFSQSWAFSMFPGVHYNFVCRTHTLPNENNSGRSAAMANRISRRRRNSVTAANLLLSKTGGKRKSRRSKRRQ